jgi:hypothetical protein
LRRVVAAARVVYANEPEELAKREARQRKADRNAGGHEKKFREYGHDVRRIRKRHARLVERIDGEFRAVVPCGVCRFSTRRYGIVCDFDVRCGKLKVPSR